MQKNTVNFRWGWLGAVGLAPLWVAACGNDPMSLGNGSAGASASGGTGATAGAGGSASQQTCDKAECGPQLGIANQICPDGSTGGPTGRCLKNTNGSCSWEIRQCPTGGGGAGGEASGGGTGTGGTTSGPCGGSTCSAEQVCCGPAECGYCISKLSGAACPATCDIGAAGAGGAPDCTQLLDDVTKTQAAAQACNPASAKPTPECAGSLEGRCCPIGVESADPAAPANAAYLDALSTYKASCHYPCPLIACIDPKVGDCKPTSATAGKCGP